MGFRRASLIFSHSEIPHEIPKVVVVFGKIGETLKEVHLNKSCYGRGNIEEHNMCESKIIYRIAPHDWDNNVTLPRL